MLQAYVDNIQGGSARVLIGNEAVAIAVPVSELPVGTRQGAMLRVRLTLDQAATLARARDEKVRGGGE